MRRAILVLTVFFIFVSCSKNSPTAPENTETIWPLKVGNSWAYTNNSNSSTIVERIRVIGTQLLHNTEVSIIVWESLEDNSSNDTMAFNIEKDGVYGYWEGDIEPKALIFKYPVNVGETWSYPWTLDGGTAECISTNEQIQTPAGEFNCIVYRVGTEDDIQNDTFWLEAYMCPGVGWVASRTKNNESFDWLYLQSYELN